MQIHKFTNREDWLEFRKGKITGTRLKDIVVKRGTTPKKGYYELIAERLAVTEEEFEGFIPNETPMDRGTRLEKHAIERFRKETEKQVDESLLIWANSENPDITISPDGVVILKGKKANTEAVECKCLSSASHIEAWLTQSIPDEYTFQNIQYFIVNTDLQKLYWVFYDPRIPAKDFFIIEVNRKDMQAAVDMYLEYQKKTLLEINDIVNKLIGF